MVNYTSEKSRARAEAVVKQIEKHGSKALLCQGSVYVAADIAKLVDAALKLSQTGKIDILIHKFVSFEYHTPTSRV